MTVLPRIAALLAVVTLATAATADAATPARTTQGGTATVLSVEQTDTPIDGWNDWLVWSRRTDDGRYALIVRTPEGEGVSLPTTPQPTPIDASIGPGPDGAPLIVYSRCTTPAPEPRGCDVHWVSPVTGAGGRVPAASRADREERLPTVWGNRIAFSLASQSSPTRAGIAIATLNGSAPRRATIHGARTERVGGRRVALRTYRPRGIDLREKRVAFSWQAQGRSDRWYLLQATGARTTTLLTARTTSNVVSRIGRPAIGLRDVVAPLVRAGGRSTSTIVRSNFVGSRRWVLKSGFSAAQTLRYGSALTAVARTDDRDLVVVRRLASDGRWSCAGPSADASAVSGCELLRYADPSRAWTRLTSASTR